MKKETLSAQIKTNLLYYNLWTVVNEHDLSNITVCSGYPPEKLDSLDKPESLEWVVPKLMAEKLTIETIDGWFKEISSLDGQTARPKRITIGLINDDGTIVYYFIHDGISKPRQN